MSTNLAYGRVTPSFAYSGNYTPAWRSGAIANIVDNNLSTYDRYAYTGSGLVDSGQTTVQWMITFATPIYIDNFTCPMNFSGNGYFTVAEIDFYAKDQDNNTHQLYHITNLAGFNANAFANVTLGPLSFGRKCSSAWIQMTSRVYKSGGGAQFDNTLYEFQANAPSVDSGIRVKASSGIVTLAVDPISASAVKIEKSSGAIQLLLLDPADPSASPVRIKASGGVFSVGKVY